MMLEKICGLFAIASGSVAGVMSSQAVGINLSRLMNSRLVILFCFTRITVEMKVFLVSKFVMQVQETLLAP